MLESEQVDFQVNAKILTHDVMESTSGSWQGEERDIGRNSRAERRGRREDKTG